MHASVVLICAGVSVVRVYGVLGFTQWTDLSQCTKQVH